MAETQNNTHERNGDSDGQLLAAAVDAAPAKTNGAVFPIVGIGASAGGLEALETFFAHMPAKTGMAFIVIQHLSPDFKSVMDELLARHTSIPIFRVENGMAVEPDAIYLIPPKKEMIISGGKLLLSDKDPGQGLTLPIDIFMRSLAQDVGPRAIGVILSGTGSDGSRGVCDIHEAGGLVLAQSLDSCKFDGMPKSAQETGVVDAVLPPATMSDALLAYLSGEPAHMLVNDPATLKGMDAIFNLLRKSCGIDFSHYKRTTVTRRVQRRLSMNRITDLEEYVERLRSDPDELNSLYKDLLIGVTKFFRDSDAFARLAAELIPNLLAQAKPDAEIRMWVAGCATGEEAYSLAILVHEQLELMSKKPRVKIFATDVHATSLEIASAGLYSEASLSMVSPQRLARYFKRTGASYHVAQDLRQMIVFAPHNIIKDAPFTKLDLITCRNLLIYLEPLAQKKALSLFHFGLNTGGMLMLGPSESPGELSDEFEVLDEHWKIYRKRREKRLPADMRLPLSPGLSAGLSRVSPAPSMALASHVAPPDGALLRAYDALLAEHAPPSLLVSDRRELVQSFGGASKFLSFRDGRHTSDVLELIDPALRLPLTTALQQAASKKSGVSLSGIRLAGESGEMLKLSVKPLPDRHGGGFLLVSFEISAEPRPAADHGAATPGGPRAPLEGHSARWNDEQASQLHLRELEVELRHAKENLQATIEELETSNEELQATNEELVASNEELQSTNEELHSVNEELYSVNAEYQKKISELTELTADMDNLLQSTDVGVIFLDRDLCIRRFTPRIAETFHLLPQDVGRRIDSFAHNIERSRLLEDVAEVLRTEKPMECEVRDHAGCEFFLRVLPYRTKRRIDGVVLTLIDISAIKQAEQDLRLMSKVFQDGADPIILESLDGTILDANAEAQRFYGFERREMIGKHVEIFIPPDERRLARDLRKQCPEAGGIRNVETKKIAKGDKIRSVLLTLSLLTNESGRPVAIASIAKDITALKKAEEKARDAVRRRDQLLAMLSHELRNPLGAVLNATYLFDRNQNVPPLLGEATGIIQRQALQMARLLDDLLDVSRVTQGKIEIRREVLNLNDLVEDAVQAVRPLIEARGHALSIQIEPGPHWVEGDASRLQQIEQNLLTNAAKYTPPGGRILLALRSEGDDVVLSVRDSGKGIPADMLESIFELFVQSEDTLDRSDGGMGVGLTLVRTLVELHGGSVSAASDGPNRGSEFVVRLPRTAKPAPASTVKSAPDRNARNLRIVVVEDNVDSRKMLEAFLRLDGFQVTTAKDGVQGVEKILTEKPDLALVDIGLPGLDGYQVCRKIREAQGESIRLVALTGYGRAEDRQAVKDAGFDAHLVKPLKPDELSRLLSSYRT